MAKPTAEERAKQIANYARPIGGSIFCEDVEKSALRHIRAAEAAACAPLERQIAELEMKLAKLREAAQAVADVLPDPEDDAMKPIDFEGINEYTGILRAALAVTTDG